MFLYMVGTQNGGFCEYECCAESQEWHLILAWRPRWMLSHSREEIPFCISSLKLLVRKWLSSLRKACEKPWKRNGKRILRWSSVFNSRKHQEVLLRKQAGYLTKGPVSRDQRSVQTGFREAGGVLMWVWREIIRKVRSECEWELWGGRHEALVGISKTRAKCDGKPVFTGIWPLLHLLSAERWGLGEADESQE